MFLAGCGSLPPSASNPKSETRALDPDTGAALHREFASGAQEHPGTSGFSMLNTGIDGLLARIEVIDGAQRTLDLQYYIFRADVSGTLVSDALLRAAQRGVRVRILVDDGETVRSDENVLSLTADPRIEVRIFNPFTYRGHNFVVRGIEFLARKKRLDFRMHNKLLVADNAVALIGGRNIGDQYFQIDPASQFGDDDVVVIGPEVHDLSNVFDKFWNSPISVPAAAIDRRHTTPKALAAFRATMDAPLRIEQPMQEQFRKALAAGAPFAALSAGHGWSWSAAHLAYDSPDKRNVEEGNSPGRLIYKGVADRTKLVKHELLMVTPYFVPSGGEEELLRDARQRGVIVRSLTNSLAAAPVLAAQAGYIHYRPSLLQEGVQLYEIRASLGSARGSGQTQQISRYGQYALHAKLFVFDRESMFIGSMNFDQRSRYLNTEIGLIIDSPELSALTARRFDALVQPENAYAVSLRDPGKPVAKHVTRLIWRTLESGRDVEYQHDPAKNLWQRIRVKFLSFLPIEREL